jgi:hypothetical protein
MSKSHCFDLVQATDSGARRFQHGAWRRGFASETLAGEVAPFGITVNKVLPGRTETARLALIVEAKASRSSKLVEAMAE